MVLSRRCGASAGGQKRLRWRGNEVRCGAGGRLTQARACPVTGCSQTSAQ